MTAHEIKLKVKVKTGASKKRIKFALLGRTGSFKSNFNPSANGCKIPKNPTTFGPFRLCIDAITLRSAKVKKATPTKRGRRIPRIPYYPHRWLWHDQPGHRARDQYKATSF
jgi:hypothetical protein